MIPVRVIGSLSKLIIIMGLEPVEMWQHSHTPRFSPNVGLNVRVSRWKRGEKSANEWSYKNWLSVCISLMCLGKCVVQSQASDLSRADHLQTLQAYNFSKSVGGHTSFSLLSDL